MEVGLSPGDIVLVGEPTTPTEMGTVCLCGFVMFVLPVSAYALLGCLLTPFSQSLAPDIAFCRPIYGRF